MTLNRILNFIKNILKMSKFCVIMCVYYEV